MELKYIDNFSFTLTIPSFKNIYFKSKRQRYNDLSQHNQYVFLENHMNNIVKNIYDIKWVYEEHEDKRLHIHGFIRNSNLGEVEQFVKDFYQYGQIINMSEKSYKKVSNIQKTILNINYFYDYMQKNQDKIKYKMGYLEQLENHSNLNGVKHNFKILIQPNTRYDDYSSSDEKPNPEYLFGKKLFTVDF